jgi:hypothetical protein
MEFGGYIMKSRMKLSFAVAVAICSATLSFANGAAAQESNAELAQQLSNPLASLISVPIQTNYDQGFGDGDGYRWYTNFQPVIPISLNDNWNVISRTIIPVIWDQKGISPLDPSGHQTGFSDTVQSVFFSPKQPTPLGSMGDLVWGVGPVFTFPTGNADPLLGSGKWSAGPTAVALVINGGMTSGMLLNHQWSFAGDEDRADVNTTFIQPFVSYTTPDAWSYTLNMESSYNWDAEQWSIPVNLMVAKLTSIGSQKVSVQGGVRYWAASPEYGPEDFGARLAVTFLFPK